MNDDKPFKPANMEFEDEVIMTVINMLAQAEVNRDDFSHLEMTSENDNLAYLVATDDDGTVIFRLKIEVEL